MEEVIAMLAVQLKELKETMRKIEIHLADISTTLKNAPSGTANTEQGKSNPTTNE